ncbi:MerR family transcriptional regulator [Paenibacillus tepidiphilus]|uniref:MerR family transcriptional regulator n=1 Tax=Paenibacillus tepidiphilus TaxID=2608683 RepID=UPI0013A5BB20|nr:MerR family transcriptional regulator [Paenibacillus tepidiphilus]
MRIGEFVREMETTADTVRYYMELHLLKPEFKEKRYCFGDQEVRDFQAIVQLKQWGLAVKDIQRLFQHKEQSGCGATGLLAYARELLLHRVHMIDCQVAELGRQRDDLVENLAEVEQVLKQMTEVGDGIDK